MTATSKDRRIGEALARIAPSVLAVYAAYTVSYHVLAGLGPSAPPLAQFSGLELGLLDAATLIYYVVAGFLVFSTAASGYYAFTIGATHRAVAALSILPLVSASLGRLSMGDVLALALVGLLLLYLYPYRRRYVVEERQPETLSTGISALHVVLAASFYILPPLLALGGSALVTAAMSFIIKARPEVPPPLPDIWGLFSSTRLAFILVAVTATAAVLWVLGELVEGLLLFYTLTPRDALLRARKAVEEDLGMLEAWSTWHQRIMVWSASTIMGVLIYPLVYGATWRIVWRAGASMPSWLLLAVDLTATILLWRLFHLYVRGIVVHRGVHRGAALVAVPVALLASYAVLAMLGIVPVDPIYYALGLRPPSSRGDVLSSVWSNEAMRRSLEGMFKEFERIARIVVRLLWG